MVHDEKPMSLTVTKLQDLLNKEEFKIALDEWGSTGLDTELLERHSKSADDSDNPYSIGLCAMLSDWLHDNKDVREKFMAALAGMLMHGMPPSLFVLGTLQTFVIVLDKAIAKKAEVAALNNLASLRAEDLNSRE